MKTAITILLSFISGLIFAWFYNSVNQDSRSSEPAKGNQAALVISPDKSYIAKIWLPELGGLGATMSQPYQVWVESKAGASRLMLIADKTDGIKLKWLGIALLEICYKDAQINTFQNRFVDIDRTGSETLIKTVEVRLRRVERMEECKL